MLAAEPLPGAQERLLDGVVGVLAIAQQGEGELPDAGAEAAVEHREGVVVAGDGACDELRLGGP